jgi:hypothetical protein
MHSFWRTPRSAPAACHLQVQAPSTMEQDANEIDSVHSRGLERYRLISPIVQSLLAREPDYRLQLRI